MKIERSSKDYFWFIFIAVMMIVVSLIVKSNSPRCLKYSPIEEKQTYYDFSSSGFGIMEGKEIRYVCDEWEKEDDKQ